MLRKNSSLPADSFSWETYTCTISLLKRNTLISWNTLAIKSKKKKKKTQLAMRRRKKIKIKMKKVKMMIMTMILLKSSMFQSTIKIKAREDYLILEEAQTDVKDDAHLLIWNHSKTQ